MKMKNVSIVLLSVVVSAITAFTVVNQQAKEQQKHNLSEVPVISTPSKQVSFSASSIPINFTKAASVATPTVVHVKTRYIPETTGAQQFYGDEMFEWFFGQQQGGARPSVGSGSGVIISKDGYIVTNNHVIEDATEIEVTLSNNKVYDAQLIGRDRDTDIALIKVDAAELPFIAAANSDDVLIGEWVMAVGNPFNLSSTVTAGIVSAKGRNINILENVQGNSNTAIESFIQTDAAVNPGNSGGALVNLEGELIGINTAIATPNGSYAGYSFAVPANLALKVANDLKEYGMVQRGFLGVNIRSVDDEIASTLGLATTKGVYLQNILKKGAADEAGLKEGDIILEVNGEIVNSAQELQEKIAEFRPGNVIELSYMRNNNTYKAEMTLKNKYNTTEIIGIN